MAPEFEWDAKKAEENVKKHGVAFEEALTVFADPLASIFDDPDHSGDEQRELIIGHSAAQRLLSEGDEPGLSEPEKRQRVSAETMSKRVRRTPQPDGNGMRAEYKFDYSRAKPNRFAARMARPVVAVVLEPDVASVFNSSAKVNAQLRSVLTARPPRKHSSRVRSHRRKAG
jgi:hypothetical protein